MSASCSCVNALRRVLDLCERADENAQRIAAELDVEPFDGAPLTRHIRAAIAGETAETTADPTTTAAASPTSPTTVTATEETEVDPAETTATTTHGRPSDIDELVEEIQP